jgi:nitrous oxidase accessory protein NosD
VRWGTAAAASAITALALLALVACVPGPAAAKGKRTIEVRPGASAIGKALDRADDGQMLRIHKGRYEEAVTIEKRVKLVGVGRRRPVIDGRCATPITIAVRSDGVRLKRLEVRGADGGAFPTEVDFKGVSGGRANNLIVRDTCDAEYGINVFDTGPMGIVGSRARGFDDAGFYVGGVTSTPGGRIRVRKSESLKNHRGVIVENSAGGEIVVANNDIHDNRVPIAGSTPAGVFINNSDGVRVDENELARNGIGLRLSPNSDGNSAAYNLFFDNFVDIRNQGSGNCGIDNVFDTGDALPPC